MHDDNQKRVETLVQRGVIIPCPASVEVAADIRPDRIAPGVVIHTGCKIAGSTTSIGSGAVLGAESPVTLEACQLGHEVSLKGGFHSGATYLDGSSLGSGAQVRPGTLLEEQANAAHTVGLKQTLFLPFVTAGSLINFCDALMAGGTSRKDHSEIGSSYIHFNFTPHQDKATPSLVGDVPRGVMLDMPPIFLGGQGALVGPVRVAYGTVIPAGVICRQDILDENRLYAPPPPTAATSHRAFRVGAYRAIQRIVLNNLVYLGNIVALQQWYAYVRRRVMSTDPFSQACYDGAQAQLGLVRAERIKRLAELADKMTTSLKLASTHGELALPPMLKMQQESLLDRWPELESRLSVAPDASVGGQERDTFLHAWEQVAPKTSYIKAIQSLSPATKVTGAAWLQAVVDSVSTLWPART